VSSTLAPFTVHCPSCEASFPVDPAKVPDGGIYAICSECERTFLVSRPDGVEDARDPVEAPATPPFAEEEITFEAPGDEIALEAEEEVTFEAAEDEVALEEEITFEAAGDEIALEEEVDEEEASDFSLEPTPEVQAQEPTGIEVEEPPAVEAEEPAEAEVEEPEPQGFEDLRGLASEAQSEGPSTHVGGSTLSEGAKKFGRRDPADRARRLARVLVSDIIAYYPERFQESRARGTVKDDFEAEVQKSWKEYVDQVGEEMAESTPYFTEALNEILAGGEEVF
jgi:predicted Zn finger-like uncharacterized protein